MKSKLRIRNGSLNLSCFFHSILLKNGHSAELEYRLGNQSLVNQLVAVPWEGKDEDAVS